MIILGVTLLKNKQKIRFELGKCKKGCRIKCELAGKLEFPDGGFVVGSYVTLVPFFKVCVHVMWRSGTTFVSWFSPFTVRLSGLHCEHQPVHMPLHILS